MKTPFQSQRWIVRISHLFRTNTLMVISGLATALAIISPAAAQVTLAPTISTIAGNSYAYGCSGSGGPASQARFDSPEIGVTDGFGNFYFTDFDGYVVWVIYHNGIIPNVPAPIPGYAYIVAGNCQSGNSPSGTLAPGSIGVTLGVAVDDHGNVYIADAGFCQVRVVYQGGTIPNLSNPLVGRMYTLLGSGNPNTNTCGGPSGDGGIATAAASRPMSIAVDTSGNVYFGDQVGAIRAIYAGGGLPNVASPVVGYVYRIAGNYTQGNIVSGALATNTPLILGPLAVDNSGNVYMAAMNSVFSIYKSGKIPNISSPTSGYIYTIAGNGIAGFRDNIVATGAQVNGNYGLALDSIGNVYIADAGNYRIRKVTAATGIITTIAGNGANTGDAGDGGPATSAVVTYPYGVSLNANGSLFIAEPGTDAGGSARYADVREVTSPTQISFPSTPVGLTSAQQNVYLLTTTAGTLNSITSTSPEFIVGPLATGCTLGSYYPAGTPCTLSMSFAPAAAGTRTGTLKILTSTGTANLALIGAGETADAVFNAGIITTFAGGGTGATCSGAGGPAINASLYIPTNVTGDTAGNVYFPNTYCQTVSKVNTTGVMSTIAGNGTAGYNGDNIFATSAQLNVPVATAVDTAGNVYIADSCNQRVRKVNTSGIITTVAGSGYTGNPQNNPELRVVTSCDDGSFSGDTGPATGAELNDPEAIALDAKGGFYINDQNNFRIRYVNSGGVITTVAGGGQNSPGDNGPATSASLSTTTPYGIAVDGAGNFYFAQFESCVVQKVNTSGTMTVFAGTYNSCGFAGDNNLATSAQLQNPASVSVDSIGDVFVTTVGDNRVRRINPAGIITTVAGNGYEVEPPNYGGGFSGDNGPATAAELNEPQGTYADPSGDIFIADTENSRIRKFVSNQTSLTWPTSTPVTTKDTADGIKTLTLSNPGNAPLVFTIPTTGANPVITTGFQYDTTSSCPMLYPYSSPIALSPGAECTFVIDFIPTKVGTNAGTLTLTDSAVGTTQTVSLTGTGYQPVPVASTTSLVSSTATATTAQSVEFTATVSGSAGTATGTVTFTDTPSVGSPATLGTAALSGGVAILYSTLPAGTDRVTASYAGGEFYNSSTSNAVTETVTAPPPPPPTPGFTLVASPANQTVGHTGGTAYITYQVVPTGGFTGTVSLARVGSLPTGVTATLNTATLSSPYSSVATATVVVSSGVGPANFPITVMGTGTINGTPTQEFGTPVPVVAVQ